MFDHVPVNAAPLRRPVPSGDELARLREGIERIERTTRIGSDAPVLPTPAAIARALPGGGLRIGAAYTLDRSMPLLLELLAGPTTAGKWCAVAGMPELGIEAAREAGVDLERLVLVPHPGERWLGVASALAEIGGIVSIRPGGRVRDADAARLAARLRDRESVLLVQGAWPGAEAAIGVERTSWSGLGAGWGYLDPGEREIAVSGRRAFGAAPARASRSALRAVG